MGHMGIRPSRVVVWVCAILVGLYGSLSEANESKVKIKTYPIEDAVFQVGPWVDEADLDHGDGILAGASLLAALDKERLPAQIVVSGRYRKGNHWRQISQQPLKRIYIEGVVRPDEIFESELSEQVPETFVCLYALRNCTLRTFSLRLNGQGVDLDAAIQLMQGGTLLGRMMTWVRDINLRQDFEMAGLSAEWIEPKCSEPSKKETAECQPGAVGRLDQR